MSDPYLFSPGASTLIIGIDLSQLVWKIASGDYEIRTLIIQVLPEHRLGWIKATVDDVHEQAFVGAGRLCQ